MPFDVVSVFLLVSSLSHEVYLHNVNTKRKSFKTDLRWFPSWSLGTSTMAVIIKRPRALSDLAEIWDYIADDSEARADAFVATIDAKQRRLG